MRPDLMALRELEELIHNLTDQLAGYRRRALSAESRVRELEHAVLDHRAEREAARREMVTLMESRDHALAAAREALAEARSAREALAERDRMAPAADLLPQDGRNIEAEHLEARLTEARERTGRLIQRVRFLRQQMVQSADR